MTQMDTDKKVLSSRTAAAVKRPRQKLAMSAIAVFQSQRKVGADPSATVNGP